MRFKTTEEPPMHTDELRTESCFWRCANVAKRWDKICRRFRIRYPDSISVHRCLSVVKRPLDTRERQPSGARIRERQDAHPLLLGRGQGEGELLLPKPHRYDGGGGVGRLPGSAGAALKSSEITI